MNDTLETELREVLRDAPEPDWVAFRAAVEQRAGHQKRSRMLRGSVGALAAAAAVAGIAVGVANLPGFGDDASQPAKSSSPSPSATPSPSVPDSTAFQPRVKLANGDYRMPMAFPRVAPTTEEAPEGLTLASGSPETWPNSTFASNMCLGNTKAPSPQPWASGSWRYSGNGGGGKDERAAVDLTATGWPQGTARTAMTQLATNSGACTFSVRFSALPWPGLSAMDANQFVFDDELAPGGRSQVAVRRVGDLTLDARVSLADEDKGLAQARALVDKAVEKLLASKALDSPEPTVWEWAEGSTEMFEAPTPFILPAIAPSPSVAGVPGLTMQRTFEKSSMSSVPVMGAHVGDPAYPGSEPIAQREAVYSLPDGSQGDLGEPTTDLMWSSFPDGPKAFDEIVVNRGTARWSGPMRRLDWAGHDRDVTFLGVLSGQPRPVVVALRLEGNVLISASSAAESQAQARKIATSIADAAAKNLAAFGRGPDGRPGNGK